MPILGLFPKSPQPLDEEAAPFLCRLGELQRSAASIYHDSKGATHDLEGRTPAWPKSDISTVERVQEEPGALANGQRNGADIALFDVDNVFMAGLVLNADAKHSSSVPGPADRRDNKAQVHKGGGIK